jgi:D-glycero-D-manno-heptose 1,7-bisphosphate phosphatase
LGWSPVLLLVVKPAVFLDRDDTLIVCNALPPAPPPAAPGDLCDPELVQPLPGVHDALLRLKAAGFLLVVVSNQGGVARGGLTPERVQEINERVSQTLAGPGGRPLIDRFYFCPFHPKGNVAEYSKEHPWRKPAPGMILAARDELGVDLASSWMVGDAARDIEAGINAGIAVERCLRVGPDQKYADLGAAADVILRGR